MGMSKKSMARKRKTLVTPFQDIKKSRSHSPCKQASILLQYDRQRHQRVSPTVLDLIIIINLFTWASLTKGESNVPSDMNFLL